MVEWEMILSRAFEDAGDARYLFFHRARIVQEQLPAAQTFKEHAAAQKGQRKR